MSAAKALSIVGRGVDRYEGRDKVTGRVRYAADDRPERLAYAAGVHSTIAAGELLELDLSAAERAPGVLDILRHRHCPRVKRASNSMAKGTKVGEVRVPFEDQTIYYAGQFIAAVVAETFEQARAAARLVRAVYRAAPCIVDMEEAALWPGASRLEAETPDEARGDPAGAWDRAEVKLDAVYTTPIEVHNAMELHGAVARWEKGRLIVRDSTQWVVGQRKALAEIFGLPMNRVTVIAEHVGGGFGGKLFLWPHTVVAAMAAKRLGRPVKLVLERAAEFTTAGYRPFTRQRVRLGARPDGSLVSLRHESLSNTSMVDEFLEDAAEASKSLYRCPHAGIAHRIVPLNLGTPTSMRAPGAAPGSFGLESAMDELAHELQMDPVDFRRRNEARRDEAAKLPWSGRHLEACYEAACTSFGWGKRKPRPGSMREGSEILGWGFATATWPALRKSAQARVELEPSGKARVYCATQDIGTGSYTVIAQVAAEELGLPLEAIEVRIGSSDYPEGPISGGSMATASFVPAVQAAARQARARLRRTGRSAVGEGEAEPGAERKKYSFRSFGAHCVEVRWDPGIARLRVSRVSTAIDVGRIMNRKTAENQVRGAVVMGIGMALLETSVHDRRTGRCVTDNLADYLVCTNADAPAIAVEFIEEPDPHIGGFGARGVGEIGITGIAAAVANAIFHATGKRFRRLPIRIEDLLSSF